MAPGDHTLVSHLKSDPANAPLGPQDKAMIDFSLKLTHEPSSVSEKDIYGLGEAGFTEEQIVDIVLITCLFNFMDRLADGLGVELSEEMQRLVEQNANLGKMKQSLPCWKQLVRVRRWVSSVRYASSICCKLQLDGFVYFVVAH